MEVKMKEIKKYLILSFMFVFNVLFLTTINAASVTYTNSTNYQNSGYDYQIDNYDIKLVVNENNVIDITENIGAYFNINKHGIFRKLPLRNKVERLDGTTSNNRVRISDVFVSENSTTYNENGYKVIKIGDPNITLNGPQDYAIKYSYNLGKDTGKGYDELYFNLIGNEWDTTINNISFTIEMPKKFNKNTLGFSSGAKYLTNNSNVNYNVVGNTIVGSYNGTLNPGEALTVRLELPEGYFIGASFNFDYIIIISLLLPIIFAVISLLLWSKYGKDNKVIETVEFYPPEDYNSAEIGYLYKGISTSEDVVSLLVYLANKGYLKIVESDEKGLFFNTKDFKIIKLKEYDGNNSSEKIFFDGLFKLKNEVTSEDLRDYFYITLGRITERLNDDENKYRIFDKKSFSKNFIMVIMIIATFFVITVKPVVEYSGFVSLIFALVFPGIGFTVLFAGVFGKIPGMPKLFALVWGSGFGGMPWAFMVLPAIMTDTMYLVAYIVGLISICIMCIVLQNMSKRTKYGNEILGKIRGFKNFLTVVEKEKLEELVMQDPTYFYNILPYTYVLGVSEKWIKKFEVIAISPPSWYDGREAFSYATFSSFMSNTMTSAVSSMSSSPSSSSGGSSGGGSSGGGSGGGGGGSW
jgi:uncharacterized membrane protein